MPRLPVPGFVLALALGWLGLAILAPAGIFVQDEFTQVAAMEALTAEGSLFIENGYERFGSEALWFIGQLRPGTEGLTPQYPTGYVLLTAPFQALAGLNGVMVLNALLAGLVLLVCHRLALLLNGSRRVADAACLILAVASFLSDYAVSLLPHAPSTLAVLLATHLTVRAVLAPAARGGREALLAGFVLGLGVSVRPDVVLVLPGLALWAVLITPRPFALILPGLIGTLPGLGLAIWLNWLKFGSPLPVSYGWSDGGYQDPAQYLPFALACMGGLAFCLLVRRSGVRQHLHLWRYSWALGLLAVGALALGAVLSPWFGGELQTLGGGLWLLIVDLRAVTYMQLGIERLDNGVVLFWGLHKKALGQSLPWLGALTLLAMAAWRGSIRERSAILLLGFAAVFYILPFAHRHWHGGYASNIRYFLPIVPHLAILGGMAWVHLAEAAEARRGPAPPLRLFLLAGLGVAAGLLALPWALDLHPLAVVHSVLPVLLMGALAVLAPLALLWSRAVPAARLLLAMTLVLAAGLAALDLRVSLERRAFFAAAEPVFERLPDNSLVYAVVAEPHLAQIRRPESHLALPFYNSHAIDHELIRKTLTAERRVFVQGALWVRVVLAQDPALEAVQITEPIGWLPAFWEIRRGG